MLIAVAMSSETGLTTMQAVICFVDLVSHHTRACTVGQFNSGNRICAALRFPDQGIVGLPPGVTNMPTRPLLLYRGYELHPLVFARTFSRFDGHSRYDEGYDIAVRICRPGAIATSAASRVFRPNQAHALSDFGMARRAARQHGKDIIDGKVSGSSVVDM